MTDELLGLDAFKQKPRKIGDDVWVLPPRTGCLAVTKEHFNLRANLAMHYYNKSTLARKFLNACATLGEPGWSGHLTLELYNQTDQNFMFYNEQPIGQVIFINLDQRSDNTYSGKYQGQGAVPVPAR